MKKLGIGAAGLGAFSLAPAASEMKITKNGIFSDGESRLDNIGRKLIVQDDVFEQFRPRPTDQWTVLGQGSLSAYWSLNEMRLVAGSNAGDSVSASIGTNGGLYRSPPSYNRRWTIRTQISMVNNTNGAGYVGVGGIPDGEGFGLYSPDGDSDIYLYASDGSNSSSARVGDAGFGRAVIDFNPQEGYLKCEYAEAPDSTGGPKKTAEVNSNLPSGDWKGYDMVQIVAENPSGSSPPIDVRWSGSDVWHEGANVVDDPF